MFANTNNNPQTLFFSKSGDYENMTTGTNADDAMIYTIASNQVNAIRFLKSQRTLVVGTTGGEFTVSADGTDAAITPTNILLIDKVLMDQQMLMLSQLVMQYCFYKEQKEKLEN